jgi:hypothetical protein
MAEGACSQGCSACEGLPEQTLVMKWSLTTRIEAKVRTPRERLDRTRFGR